MVGECLNGKHEVLRDGRLIQGAILPLVGKFNALLGLNGDEPEQGA